MKRILVLTMFLGGGLAACAPDLPGEDVAVEPVADAGNEAIAEEPAKDPSEDLTLITCGADKVLDLVGMPLTEEGGRLPEGYRPIAPADVVTQDYDTKRMNVFVDEKGVITKIDCG